MVILIVDLPFKNGDFPYQTVSLPEGNLSNSTSNGRWENYQSDYIRFIGSIRIQKMASPEGLKKPAGSLW